LHSTATSQALGPGSRYEIDATIADIYLVSNSNPESIVGRPTIYFVIDVFSRLVAGFYIGFESPSYLAAIQALNIAMTDKVKFVLNTISTFVQRIGQLLDYQMLF
jgi:transposase InsO family protein